MNHQLTVIETNHWQSRSWRLSLLLGSSVWPSPLLQSKPHHEGLALHKETPKEAAKDPQEDERKEFLTQRNQWVDRREAVANAAQIHRHCNATATYTHRWFKIFCASWPRNAANINSILGTASFLLVKICTTWFDHSLARYWPLNNHKHKLSKIDRVASCFIWEKNKCINYSAFDRWQQLLNK